MAKSNERELWRWLRKANAIYPDLHLVRIENAVDCGTPDVAGCLMRRHFWIELKSVRKPVRASTLIRPGLSDAQIEWAEAHCRAWGRCSVLLQIGSGRNREIWLIDGIHARTAQNGLTLEQIRRGRRMNTPRDVIEACTQ